MLLTMQTECLIPFSRAFPFNTRRRRIAVCREDRFESCLIDLVLSHTTLSRGPRSFGISAEGERMPHGIGALSTLWVYGAMP